MRLYRSNVADLPQPTLSDVTKTTIKVTGDIGWYKDGEWGIAYKKSADADWTYKAQTSKSLSAVSLTSLTANTAYDVCLYVKFGSAYQRGTVATATTLNS